MKKNHKQSKFRQKNQFFTLTELFYQSSECSSRISYKQKIAYHSLKDAQYNNNIINHQHDKAMELKQFSKNGFIPDKIGELKQMYFGVQHIIRQASDYPDSPVDLLEKLIKYAETIKRELAEFYGYNLSPQEEEVSIGISGPPNLRECLNNLTVKGELSPDQKAFLSQQLIVNQPYDNTIKSDNNEITSEQQQVEYARFYEEYQAQPYDYEEVYDLRKFLQFRLSSAEEQNIGNTEYNHQQNLQDHHETHQLNQFGIPAHMFGNDPNQQTILIFIQQLN